MSLRTILSKSLSPELMQQVEDALEDDFDLDGDYIPRSRLNKVIKQRNQLRKQLESQAQGDDDDDDFTGEGGDGQEDVKSSKTVQSGISDRKLQRILADKDRERDDAIQALKVQYAVLDTLRNDVKAKDAELVYGLLDASALSIGEDGKLVGLDEQLNPLKEGKAFLFDVEQPDSDSDVPDGTGKSGGGTLGSGSNTIDNAIDAVFAGFGIEPVVD